MRMCVDETGENDGISEIGDRRIGIFAAKTIGGAYRRDGCSPDEDGAVSDLGPVIVLRQDEPGGIERTHDG